MPVSPRCPKCARDKDPNSLFCAGCGYRFHSSSSARPREPVSPFRWAVPILALALLMFVFLGNYRVVSGAPSMLVNRQNFGFDDTFAKVADCTSTAWIVVTAQHGPLCSDLQAAGILESDAAREERLRREFQAEYEQIQQDMIEQSRELQAEMLRDLYQ